MAGLFEPAGHTVFEGVKVIGQAMVMDEFLFEPAPEFFDGVEPRGVSGEVNQLNRQVFADELLSGRQMLPGLGQRHVEGVLLWLQGGPHIWVPVDAPVVQDDENRFARVLLGQVGKELHEAGHRDFAAYHPGHFAAEAVHRAADAKGLVRPKALARQGLLFVRLAPIIAHRGVQVHSELVHEIKFVPLRVVSPDDLLQILEFALVVLVGAVQVLARAQVADAHALERRPKTRQRVMPEGAQSLSKRFERPPALRVLKVLRALAHDQFGLLPGLLPRQRGKKRACGHARA